MDILISAIDMKARGKARVFGKKGGIFAPVGGGEKYRKIGKPSNGIARREKRRKIGAAEKRNTVLDAEKIGIAVLLEGGKRAH